jgi:2-oxoisovalerate dehydrogenase E2 component (dihydrolipoyl transacylase)
MGEHVIKMPDLGEGIAEVEVVAWRVQPGELVVEDQVLADVMTDKATVEIPSPVHGTVLALGGAVGAALAVGAELIRLQVEGSGNAVAGKAAAAPRDAKAAAPEPAPQKATAAVPPAHAPDVNEAALASDAVTHASHASRGPGEKPLAAPAVRQRAWDLGVELQFVAGSGPAGRITHADLDAYVARGKVGGTAATGGNRDDNRGDNRDDERGDKRYAELQGEHAVALIGMRRKIAEKMQDAKRRIPHFTYVEEVDVTDIEALRLQLNTRWGFERGRLTLLPLLMRAVVLGVRGHPQVNARFDDEAGIVTSFSPVHIGIATQTDAGLMVPVVRHAEARDPWSNAAELTRLAGAARAGKALREDLSGSTITITSLGALGGIVTTPIINHPEVAIVGVNRIVERPVIRDGAVVARKMMNLSCSFDHRIIDGVVAAEFVQAIRGFLECPATLFVE